MSDEDQQDHPEDGRIRALLADLGSGPEGRSLPPEVAARLDDTLARLVAERSASSADTGEPTGTVVPLRRRWFPRVTAAAAAVIVLGAGGVSAVNLGVFGGLSSDSKAGSASSDAGGTTAPESAPEVAPAQPQPPNGGVTPGKALGGALDRPQVRAATFASDVIALLEQRGTPTPEQQEGSDTQLDQAEALRSTGCPGPVITDGAVPTRIRYDGSPAVLVIHPENSDGRLVEAWDCAGLTRLAGATLTR